MIIETRSEKETFELGKKIGEKAKPGQIYRLDGDLGDRKDDLYKKEWRQDLGFRNLSAVLRLRLCRCMTKAECHFIILMCIESEIRKRWKRSDMRTTLFWKRDLYHRMGKPD